MLEDKDGIQKFFEEVAGSSCQALFSDYGVNLQRLDPVAATGDDISFLMCGVIGFSGRDVRGTMMLAITEAPLGKSNPLQADAKPRDWLAELANQLLGRIKNRLLRHHVEIYLNLPAVLRGEHLAPVPRDAINPIRYSDETGVVGIWIEVEAGPGFKISELSDTEEAGPETGDTLLF